MILPEGLKAVLLDVLHTLVDDSGFPARHLPALLSREGYKVDAEAFEAAYRSLTAREFDWEAAASETPFRSIRQRHDARVEALYEALDLSRERDASADTERLWGIIASSRVYPDVEGTLTELAARGYRLALISNADEDDPVIQALLRAELPVTFEAIVTSQGAGAYKPSRRIFEHALWKLKLGSEEVVLVGDSPASDILGAARAGIPAIWLNRRGRAYPEGYPVPAAEIGSLDGLLELLPATEGGRARG